jgi:hypothetical protein
MTHVTFAGGHIAGMRRVKAVTGSTDHVAASLMQGAPHMVHIIVTVLAAAWVAFSAYSILTRAAWVVDPLTSYGVPSSWWPWLGAAKAAGAAGMLVGLLVPVIGVLAGIGLILYFLGAVVTVLRARSYSTVVYPLLYLVPVVAALVLGATA